MRSIALCSALLATALAAQSDATGDVAVRCGKLFIGDGAVLTDAWLVVRDGKITSISAGGEAPADLTVIDARDKVIMPGIVAADSNLSGHGDNDYAVTPDFVALDGFDFMRSYRRALSGGVTTAYLAPGRTRLVSGQGSVVKLAGRDLVQRVLAENACLRLTLGKESTTAPALFEPTVAPTSDDPLLPARKQYPSARISQLATLRRLFRTANLQKTNELLGTGSSENHYDLTPLRRVASGSLPLRVAAREAADIRRATQFAEQMGVRLVLENPFEIGTVAHHAAARATGAVFRIPVRVSANNRGGENLADRSPQSSPKNPGIAARAGLTVAIAPIRDDDLADFLLVAGIAIRYGMAPDQALRAVTLDAARVLGVDQRVGSLAPGKDADFLVLSGEPFAVGTMVEQTFVDGRSVYERQTSAELLAVRADKIITAAGDTYRNGVILIADGKIKGVGEDLAIPYGARILEVDGGVMVPGFIDAFSSLGLSGDGTGVPSGAADQRIGEVVRPDDPNFEAALEAGLTTALVSGRDGGTVSGRITAIKLGADDRESMVVREVAGVRFVHDAIGTDAIKPLSSAIDKAKRYIDAWAKYEKALADFKAGKGKKPIEEAAPLPVEKPNDPVSGTWECEMDAGQFQLGLTLVLKLADTTVTGTAAISFGGQGGEPEAINSGSFENGTLTLSISMRGNESTLTGKIEDDKFTGSIAAMGQQFEVTGVREGSDAAAVAAATNGSAAGDSQPRKPAVDESLEPIRAILEGRATAVIKTERAPAIRDVVEFCREAEIPFVLHGVRDAIDTPELLGEETPPVMLGPRLVRRDGAKVINAAASLADRDVELAIVTGDNRGGSYLPLHAAHAIRYGMDPRAALAAVTIGPARMFKIDDRVGSLEKGKDADLVVFSGNPFELTSRVMLVICNGKVVVDNREGR